MMRIGTTLRRDLARDNEALTEPTLPTPTSRRSAALAEDPTGLGFVATGSRTLA